MNTSIQLIQLTVRIEREEKAQRCASTTHCVELVSELAGYLHKLNNRIKQTFNPPRHQHCCECA